MIDNPAFNAFAFEPSSNAIIGIYAGAAIEVWLVSAILFSHRSFLPDIGEALGETSTYERLPNSFKFKFGQKVLSTESTRVLVNSLVSASRNCFLPAFLEPITQSRLNYAYLVASRAIHFIYLHELSHILLGHCRYLSNRFRLNEFHELGVSRKDLMPLQLLHLFETQADSLASRLFRTWFRNDNGAKKVAGSDVSMLNLLGAMIVFWTMGFRQSNITELFDTDHPHPTVRMQNVMFNGIFDEPGNGWSDRYEQVERDLTEVFVRLGRNIMPYEAKVEFLAHKAMVAELGLREVNKELQKFERYPKLVDAVRM